MPTARISIQVDASPEVVFDFVSQAERIPEYVPFVRDVFEVSDRPVRCGTVVKEHSKSGPVPVVTTWHVAEFERPRRQVWAGRQADMDMTLTKTTEPLGGGTRYSQVMEYRLLPRFRPLGWLLEKLIVSRAMDAEFARIADGIKRIIETEQADPAFVTPVPSSTAAISA